MVNTHADKTQENKGQSAANAVSQMQSDDESAFQFADNRPEGIAQRKLQEMANNSPQVSQLSAFQAMANNSPRAKQTAQLQAMADNSPVRVHQPIQKKENNTGLPDNLKSGIENLSGFSMNDVKVNYNSNKPAQLQAHAYAQGTDIHLASGQEKHLPHEAWHVVQQKQGRVKPTMQMKGNVDVNDDTGLEKEADVMGTKAMSFESSDPVSEKRASQFSGSTPVQRVIIEQSTAETVATDLAKYCEGKKTLKGATDGASGEVYLSEATEDLAAAVLAEDITYVGKGDQVVVKHVVVRSMDSIRTEKVGDDKIPLEGLLPDKLNDGDVGDIATTTYATIQVMGDDEKISSYYLIMEHAVGGDQAHKKVKKAEINGFNDKAKLYYNKLEVIFTHLGKSGFNSGDIKPANIFLNAAGLPMLGDFGDYTVGPYTRKATDIAELMNDLMKTSGHKKTYDQIKAWAADASLWTPAAAPALPVAQIPVVLPLADAVQHAVVAQQE